MLSVTKIFEFESAHFLLDHPGKCKAMHGHSYKLEVEVGYGRGDALNENGMIIDFGDLKKIIQPLIDNYLDHKFLNDSLHSDNPTAEKMLFWIVERIELPPPVYLLRVRLWETSTSYAEWSYENEN